jgi:hypothetical protein
MNQIYSLYFILYKEYFLFTKLEDTSTDFSNTERPTTNVDYFKIKDIYYSGICKVIRYSHCSSCNNYIFSNKPWLKVSSELVNVFTTLKITSTLKF